MQKINEEALSSWAAANKSQENKSQYLYNKQLALISQYHHLEAMVLYRSIEIRALAIQNECMQLKTEKADDELAQVKENERKMQGLLDQVATQIKLMEQLHGTIYGPSLQQMEVQNQRAAELEQKIKRNPMMKVGIVAEHEAKYPEVTFIDIRQKIADEGCYAARRASLLEVAGVIEGLSFEEQIQRLSPTKPKRKRGTLKQLSAEKMSRAQERQPQGQMDSIIAERQDSGLSEDVLTSQYEPSESYDQSPE